VNTEVGAETEIRLEARSAMAGDACAKDRQTTPTATATTDLDDRIGSSKELGAAASLVG
jgi:hypothetical protein